MLTSSKLIEKAVDQVASLPGIGRKTALRLVLDLLKRDPEAVRQFGQSIIDMREQISYCQKCGNVADDQLCSICANPRREQRIICVVEDMRDIMAIESTQQYSGLYHVLGGVISPMDGIGPQDLNIDGLLGRIDEIKDAKPEIILALSATMEGDTTNFYLYRKLQNFTLDITTLARGVAVGDSLEYADEVTLGRSLTNRTPYENTLSR